MPVNIDGLIMPVQESGQLNLKQTLKLMAPVFVQADRLLMMILSWLPLFDKFIHDGKAAAHEGS
jgi:hypothetical protein